MALHHEIHCITDTYEYARDSLFQRGLLKSSMPCPGCSANTALVACSMQRIQKRTSGPGIIVDLFASYVQLFGNCKQLSADSVGLLGWCRMFFTVKPLFKITLRLMFIIINKTKISYYYVLTIRIRLNSEWVLRYSTRILLKKRKQLTVSLS